MHARTGYLSEFNHASGGEAQLADAELSLAAVLVAEATNVGYKPGQRSRHRALNRARLSHVEQNYLRAETLRSANARLIEAQADIPLAGLWGGGMVASVDGLRFVVPVCTVHSGYNPHYFGRRRGADLAERDQQPGRRDRGTVVPGTERDSLYELDVMLNPDHGRRPELVTSDTAGYSDLVFGLYRICGMQYAPRLANLSDMRFWRLDPAADYGPVNDLARHRIKPDRIHPLVADAAGRGLAGDRHRARLRPHPGAQPRRQSHPAGAGLHRIRPYRQDSAPISRGRGRP